MFRKHPQNIESLVRSFIRANSLETPLLQRRLIDAWEDAAGEIVAQYTEEKKIRNQTLWVKIINPAVRADLQMKRSDLVKKLNETVGAQIITDIRVY